MLREVTTKYGKMKGLPGNDPRVTVYKGVPFASPPVGDLRWRAPQLPKSWEGTLDAFMFGPISIQDQPGIADNVYSLEWHVDPDIKMSEDCLYLNIWTPAVSTDEKLPVMVWYFGGAFQWGYTAEMEFNGERLARRGIIVVSVNYRLGAFGFLAHPGLTAESPDAPSNFGLLDQQAGLKWVYENIEAFGGDPDNITIAGQSAGGGSVLSQICNKDNYPLIKGAVIFSGIIRFPDRQDDILKPVTLKQAEARGEDFIKCLGAGSIEEARKLDALYIRDRYAEYVDTHPRIAPIVDGTGYTGDPYEMFINGQRADVPVITGYTTGEFNENGINAVEASVKKAVSEAIRNGCDQKHYLYEFSAPMPGPDDPGIFHSCDLWFWFETLSMCWRPFTGRHFMLARRMADYLANFVKYHDPNPDDDVSWHPAAADDLNIIELSI